MHPEIARELITQRGRELRERAQQDMAARTVSRIQRATRRGAGRHEADDFICPAIPDYVDGSFRAGSPTEDLAASQAGHVPAARPAA